MKIEITFVEEDARLVQSVLTYLGINDVEKVNEQVKKLVFEWAYKWHYEMGRKSRRRAGKEE